MTNPPPRLREILRFYLLATRLKDKLRSGCQVWCIDRDRIESVAEHVYGTAILAIAIDSEFDLGIDLNYVIKMIVIHELEEIFIGDLNPFDKVSPEEKLQRGRIAAERVLGNLAKRDEYLKILDEFNAAETVNAKFARLCDKLEADIQIKKWDDDGCFDMACVPENILDDERVRKIIDGGGARVSDIWIAYDQPRYADNPPFDEILKFVRENDLRNLVE